MLCLPSFQAFVFTLLVSFLGVRPFFTMYFYVTTYAQRLKIAWIEAQLLHLLQCARRFDRCLMVHVDRTAHESFSLAFFAQRVLL